MSNYLSLLLLLISLSSSLFPSLDRPTRLLLDWMPNPNHVPLYVGIDQGFFQEEKIHLQIKKIFDPADTIPFLFSNKVEVAIYYAPGTLKALSQGAKLKVIGTLIDQPLNGLIYKGEYSPPQLQDLNEKRLGFSGGTLHLTYLKLLIKEKGIAFKETKRLTCDLIAMIGTGHVDVLLGVCKNIEPVQLKAMGIATSFIPLEAFGVPSYDELVFITTENLHQKDPLFSQRFQKAIGRSIDFCKTNPQKAFEIYLAACPNKTAKTIAWEKEAWKITYPLLSSTQKFDKAKWQNFATWMQQNKLISQEIDIEGLQP